MRFPCSAEGFAFKEGFRTLDPLEVVDQRREVMVKLSRVERPRIVETRPFGENKIEKCFHRKARATTDKLF